MFTLLRYWMPMHCIDSSLQETVFQYLQIWPPFFSKKKMKLWRTTIWSSTHNSQQINKYKLYHLKCQTNLCWLKNWTSVWGGRYFEAWTACWIGLPFRSFIISQSVITIKKLWTVLAYKLDELANAEDPVQLFYKEGIAQTISAEIKEHGRLTINYKCSNIIHNHKRAAITD